MVGARKGSVILDVQLAYKPTVSGAKAFETFTQAIQGPVQSSRIQKLVDEVLSLKTEKVNSKTRIKHSFSQQNNTISNIR